MKKNKLVSAALLSTITAGTIYAINKSISIYANAQAKVLKKCIKSSISNQAF